MTPQAELPLRDIHLPSPISWWPPAPGWWLSAILLLLLAGLLVWSVRLWRRGRLRREAQSILSHIYADYGQHGDNHRLVTELSVLLRRIAISRFPRAEVASLTNRQWLAFLDQVIETKKKGQHSDFSQGVGRILAQAPYQPTAEVDAEALVTLCRTWINAVPVGGRHPITAASICGTDAQKAARQ